MKTNKIMIVVGGIILVGVIIFLLFFSINKKTFFEKYNIKDKIPIYTDIKGNHYYQTEDNCVIAHIETSYYKYPKATNIIYVVEKNARLLE